MATHLEVEPKNVEKWEDALRDLFRELAELRVFWRDQERPAVLPEDGGFVTLAVVEDRVVGIPEERLEFDAGAVQGKEFQPAIAELHLLRLAVAVETYTNAAKKRGRTVASRIRTRLRRSATVVALNRLNTSLVDIGPVLFAGVPIDNRMSSLATFEVRLHVATVEGAPPFGYIETIETEAEMVGEDGVPLATVATTIDLP